MTPNNGTPDAPRHAPAPAPTPPEMAEFLQRFRGKSPEQMLGLPPGNGLWSATLLAGGVCAALLAALTVGPYLMAKPTPAAVAKPAAPTEPAPPATPTPAKTAPVAVTGPKANPDPAGKAKPGPDVLDKLGENQTRTASPKVNPLDNKNDDLLKDLK